MKPGLHPLICIRCGAPLDPKDADVGSVVRCDHCQQPHLWVAPDKVEAEPAPPPAFDASPARQKAASKAPLLVGAVTGLVLLLVVGGAIGFLFIARAPSRSGGGQALLLPAGAPIARGDQLDMVLRSERSVQTCPVDVVDITPDGRPVGVPCNGTEPTPIARELLELHTYNYDEPRQLDVVLVRSAAGWQRAMIEAPEGGDNYRVKSLAPDGASFSAAKGTLARVQGQSYGELRGPLPANAPLAQGDVLWHRKGTVLHSGRVDEVGEGGVVLAPGYVTSGKFAPSPGSTETIPKAQLLAVIVRVSDRLEPGSVVLARSGSGWQRSEVESDLGHLLKVKDASGRSVALAKQDLLMLRVPGAPAPSGLEGLSGLAPIGTAPPFQKAITPALKRCFQQTLQKDPKANGKLSLELRVGAQGQVLEAKATQTGALPASMLTCAEEAAKKQKLDPPDGGEAIVRMSATFVTQ